MFRRYPLSPVCLAFLLSSACVAVAPEDVSTEAKALDEDPVPCWFDAKNTRTQRTLTCRYVTVPQRHPSVRGGLADQAADKLEPLKIAVVVAKGRGTSTEPPLFVLGGGPESTMHKFLGQLSFWEEIAGDRDIVAHDYRGVGNSKPLLSCDISDSDLERIVQELSIDVNAEFIDDSAFLELVERMIGLCGSRRVAGIDYRLFTARQMAADVEAIAGALGYEGAIDLVGESYGTLLAQVVALQSPARVRRAAIDGVLAYGLDYTGQWYASFDAVFGRVSEACFAQPTCRAAYCGTDSDSIPNNCDLFEQQFNASAARLSEGPIDLGSTGQGSAGKTGRLSRSIIREMMDLVSSPDASFRIPALARALYDATQGRTDSLASGELIGLVSEDAADSDVESSGDDEPLIDATTLLYNTVYCSNHRSAERRIAHSGRFGGAEAFFRGRTTRFYEMCGRLGFSEPDTELTLPKNFAAKFLALSGEFDATTTMEGAALVADLFGKERVQLRQLTHGPHVSLLRNEPSGHCARVLAREFLSTGAVTSRCALPNVDFLVPFAGPSPP